MKPASGSVAGAARRAIGSAATTVPPAAWRDSGLAIVEVLVGALVVGIAAIGIGLMFANGQAFVQAEGDRRVAVQLARQRIEQILASGFGVCPDARKETTPVDLGTINPPELRRPGYQRTTEITSVSPTNFAAPGSDPTCEGVGAPPEAKLITVTVRALDATGNADANIPAVTLTSVMVVR